MRMRIFRIAAIAVAGGVALVAGALLSTKDATAQVPPDPSFDHLECHPLRDGLRSQTYSADLVPHDGSIFVADEGAPIAIDGDLAAEGCRIRIPAREFCHAVSKENARTVRDGIAPPGAPAGPDSGEYLCYSVRCPRDRVREAFDVTDQFGTRSIQLNDTPSRVCVPAFREGAPTPAPTGTPAPTPTGEPTATPTAEPTATPTAGSASRAFVDVPDSLL